MFDPGYKFPVTFFPTVCPNNNAGIPILKAAYTEPGELRDD
jgi:hypothetical protein